MGLWGHREGAVQEERLGREQRCHMEGNGLSFRARRVAHVGTYCDS